MTILIMLIIISLILAITFLGLFVWSVRSGQYNDIDAPSIRLLYDDKPKTTIDK